MKEKIFYYNNYYTYKDKKDFMPLSYDEIFNFFHLGNSLLKFKMKFRSLFNNELDLEDYLKVLLKKRIIINDLPYPKEIFKSTVKFADKGYPIDYFFNKRNLSEFKRKCNLEKVTSNFKDAIVLKQPRKLPDYIENRCSVRSYKKGSISFQVFSDILSILCRKNDGSYFYPSAGALYPNTFYIDVKNVEEIKQGCYELDVINRKITRIGDIIGSHTQYFTNKEIYTGASMIIYITYNAEFNVPKYREYGYIFGLIEAGICSSFLTIMSEYKKLGSCILGIMNFEEIENMLGLSSNKHIIEAIAIGKK